MMNGTKRIYTYAQQLLVENLPGVSFAKSRNNRKINSSTIGENLLPEGCVYSNNVGLFKIDLN